MREHRSVPSPVSVTVLPWLHHAHCSLQGDIIIWLEQEIPDPVSVLAGKCIFKNEILNLNSMPTVPLSLERRSVAHHVFF